jgi:hypothetical protein
MVVPSASGCRRTLWPVGPGHCGLHGAPSSMVVKPVTSCRGSDFSAGPSESREAGTGLVDDLLDCVWARMREAQRQSCSLSGPRSSPRCTKLRGCRTARTASPLGKRHVPRNTHKTVVRDAHKRGHTHLSLARRSRCPWRCGLQPLAPWGGRGTLGGGCGGSGTQRPRGDVLAGTTDGWERRRPHGSSSDVQAGGGGTRCLDGRPLTRQHRELSGLAVGLEGLTGDGVERALGFNSPSSGSLVV